MNILITVRSGLANAWISSLFIALDEVGKGNQVGIMFTEEALKVLSGEPFAWSPLLRDRQTISTMARNAAEAAIKFQSSQDRRQIDVWRFVDGAREKGVHFYVCPNWSKLLGISEFPEGVRLLSQEELSQTMDSAARILYL